MTAQEILNTCKELSKSQGLYCRLYAELKDNKEALEYLEAQKFKDVVDFIMFIEC